MRHILFKLPKMIPEQDLDHYWKQIRVFNSKSIRRDEETTLVVEDCKKSVKDQQDPRKEAEVTLPMFGVSANWRREEINSPVKRTQASDSDDKIEMPVKEQPIV